MLPSTIAASSSALRTFSLCMTTRFPPLSGKKSSSPSSPRTALSLIKFVPGPSMSNKSLTTMTNQIVELDTMVEQSAPAPAEKQLHPLMWLHSLLRGRYILAIALLVIGILVGGWQGYRMQQPQYRSTG